MNRRHGVPDRAAADQKTVRALVDDLVAGGIDLRAVSLEDMKLRLAAALESHRSKAAAARLASAV